MKSRKTSFILLLSITGFLSGLFFFQHFPQPFSLLNAFLKSPQFSQSSQSIIVQNRKKFARIPKKNSKNFVFSSATDLTPAAPLDHPSEQELDDFPGAVVVESNEIDDPENPDQKIRMRILKTSFKSPYVRTEEIVDADTGALLERTEMAADHFLLNLPEGSDPQEIFNHLNPSVASMEQVSPHCNVWKVQLDNASLESLPFVLEEITMYSAAGTGEPDLIYGVHDFISNSLKGNQWALSTIHLFDDNGITASSCSTHPTTIVAVIDSGIRYTHEDLKKNIWNNPAPTFGDFHGCNFSVSDENPKKGDPMDDCGHGTHCAGIIGGTGVGTIGVDTQVQLMACKYMNEQGEGLLSDEVAAIYYAVDHGASVLNCSYGIEGSLDERSPSFSLFSQAEYNAMKYAGEKGTVIAAAANNFHLSNDESPTFPANYCVDNVYYDSGERMFAPALDNVVSVAATDDQDRLSDFSNYGVNSVMIAAPGEDILSTWSDADTSYAFLSGTSMAAPHVAGTLALLKTRFPGRSNKELINHLLATTDCIPSLQGKIKAGRLNVSKALKWM